MKSLVILTFLLMISVSPTVGAANMNLPTANVLSRLIWLGDENNMAKGSGTLVSYGGTDYLVTAHHVYADCNRNPFVRFHARWNRLQWEVVAKNESLDVIVLRSAQLPTNLETQLPVLYGVPKGAVHGQIGYSLGFPGVYESNFQPKTDHVLEFDGRPIPIAALVVANLSAASKVHYSASYINAGFSGGAIVYCLTDQKMWTIAGVITEFPIVPRPIYDGNGKETGLFTQQHTGLVGYVPMSAVLEMMEEVLGK